MTGFGTRSLPPFRVAEGDPFKAFVPQGQMTPAASGSQVNLANTWGPAPLWQPALALQQWTAQQSLVTGTTVDAVGGATPTTEGTASQHDDANIAAIDYATAATTDTDAGWQGPASHFKTRLNPTACFSFMPRTSIAVCRYWVGIVSADPMGSGTPAIHLAAFRFDNSLGSPDTRWRCLTDNGGGSPTEPTLINTPTAPVVGTRENLIVVVRSAGASIEFWRATGRLENGAAPTLLAIATADLPTTSQAMRFWCQVRTRENVAKSVAIARIGGFFS